MNKKLIVYDSPRIEKSEVYLEHVIADSVGGSAPKIEDLGSTEPMFDAPDYGGGFVEGNN